MTKFKFLLPFIAIIFVVSCASAPEETPLEPIVEQEEPVVEPEVQEEEEQVEIIEVAPEPVVEEEKIVEQLEVIEEETVVEEVYIPEPLDESLLAIAKKEVFKAQEARAQTYYPSRLQALKSKLAEAQSLKESDPDRARELLSEISIEAESLTQDSLDALKTACIDILNGKTNQLLKLNADKYTPEEFQITQTQSNETLAAFEANDFTKSLALYRIAYTSLTNLYNSLATNMGYIDNLTRIINNKRVEGESVEANIWAPTEYQIAVDSWLNAQDLLYTQYDAIAGEQSLRETLFFANKAIAQANINIEVAAMDAEIMALMGELEDASSLTILDREDNIVSPAEWDETVDLVEKPIEAEVDAEEESGLTPIDLEGDVEVTFPELSKMIISIQNGQTKVLGMRDKRRSLLQEATDLWKQGIEARNSGDLISAREYLAKSKIFLDEYKSLAVDYIYTVILNPDKRDCLWRISENEEYYGDPLLWQNIWERNKKLIQDPDLIYPGWKLIIPPIDEQIN